MQPTNNLILVCAGADTAAAAQHSLPLLQLYLGVGRGGRVTRLSLPARLEGCYLGVSIRAASPPRCGRSPPISVCPPRTAKAIR